MEDLTNSTISFGESESFKCKNVVLHKPLLIESSLEHLSEIKVGLIFSIKGLGKADWRVLEIMIKEDHFLFRVVQNS